MNIKKFIQKGGALVKVDKAQIFANARELFLTKGYKETNISDITDKTGIAVGSFYKFYKSKDEIFLQVFLEENDRLTRQVVDSVNLDGDPVDVIKEFVSRVFSGYKGNLVLMEWDSRDIYSKLQDYYAEGTSEDDSNYNLFSDIIKKWQQEGKLRSDISSDMILAFFNTFQYIELHKDLIGTQYFPQLMDYLVEFIVEGLKTKKS